MRGSGAVVEESILAETPPVRRGKNARIRIALLHYSPIAATLEGEPPGIWSVLGNERLAVPLAAHRPDLVLHGHAHKGRFEGSLDSIPVFNVAVHVTGQDFWTFELEPKAGPVGVEEVT